MTTNNLDECTKITFRLSPEAKDVLDALSLARGGVSYAEVIRRALGTEAFVVEAGKRKARILIERKSGRIGEVVLR